MSIGERIKERRKMLGLSVTDVADKLEVNRATVYRYESEAIEKMPVSIIQKLADVLNCSPAYLMGTTNTPDREHGVAPYRPGRNIFVLGRISAGVPLFADEQVEGTVSVDLPEHGDYFALRVVGDSMDAAHIFDGSLVVVKLTKEVPNNCIAIVKVNGFDATVKRFRRDGNIVQLIPQSTNPEHAIQLYDIRKVDVEIIGRVVQTIMDVN